MALDVGEHVFVVRMGTGQLRDMGMLKGVIPDDFFAGVIDFLAIAADAAVFKVDEFPDVQHDVPLKCHLTLEFGQRGANGRQHQRRVLNDRIAFLE